jgi:hypothetical protein
MRAPFSPSSGYFSGVDERLFLEAIRRDLGWQDDTPGFAQAFQEWRKLWRK